MDDAVHDDDDAAVAKGGIRSGLHGFQEIQRTVGTDSRRRPHGSGEDDGFTSVNRKIEIVRRFLHRIGTMGDDDAVDVIPVGHFLNPGRQGLP